MVLVALVTFTAIQRYGAKVSAFLGRDLVVSLGGKADSGIAGIVNTDSPINSISPVIGPAQPLPLVGGSSPVGGGPSFEPARIR